MKAYKTVLRYYGPYKTLYTISEDWKGRFHVHRIGDVIKSVIPGFPDGLERKAYRVGKMKRYGNQYRKGWRTETFKYTSHAMMAAIADDCQRNETRNPK